MPEKVFINSMPKSGTNLLARAFDLASVKYAELGISEALLIGTPYLPRQFARRSFFERDPITIGLNVQVPVRRRWLDRKLSKVGPDQYLTGHANWSPGLETLLNAHRFVTLIVVRDPRDVLLSQIHYVAKSEAHFLHKAYKGASIQERLNLALLGGKICTYDVAPFDLLLERVDAWFARSNALRIKFEDLVGAPGGGSAEKQEAVFQLLEESTGHRFDREIMARDLYGKSSTFRKGKIGSASQELAESELRRIDDVVGPWRYKWGYE